MLNGSYAIWKWRFGLFSQEVFTGCQLYSLGVCVGKKAVLYVIRQQVQEKSDNRAHVKGDASLNTAFRFQAVHKLTNHPFDDLYPAHFDHVFFF